MSQIQEHAPADVVFLLDVDNTLLDNDAVTEDLRRYLIDAFGAEREQRYWDIFEDLRLELGYADYLGSLQRYRLEHPRDPHLLRVSIYLLRYEFRKRLYPRALEVVAALRKRGPVVILSDGDVVFQPHKVVTSGLWEAVDHYALVYVHKEQMLDDVEQRFPAKRYVMVDDKLKILAAMKKTWGNRLTTVFVRQGHYAHDEWLVSTQPPADVTIDKIGDLLDAPIF